MVYWGRGTINCARVGCNGVCDCRCESDGEPVFSEGRGRAVVAEGRKERRAEDVRAKAVNHATKQQTRPNADHEARLVKKRNKTIHA